MRRTVQYDPNSKTEHDLALKVISQSELEKRVWFLIHHNPVSFLWDLRGIPLTEVAKRTWIGLNEDNLLGRASQLAYAFFSAIFPALIALSSIAGLVVKTSPEAYPKLMSHFGRLIPPGAFTLVLTTLRQTTSASSTGKITFGLAFALFSASVGISALQDTLNTIYRVKETRAFWRARLQAIALTLLVSAFVLGAMTLLLAGDVAVSHVAKSTRASMLAAAVIQILSWSLASLSMMLSFEVLYYFCPDIPGRRWRWFTPGGLIGLIGWVSSSVGLRIYLHFFNSYSVTYGSLGAVILLLLWFYITGAMILLGGEVNSQIEHALTKRHHSAAVSEAP